MLLTLLPAQGQFTQKGIVKEYNRREQAQAYTLPVEIEVKGASTTVSNAQGLFNLVFPMKHVGDTLSAFKINPANSQYTLFNAPKIQDWVLTPMRRLEVLLCNRAIIEDVQTRYTTSYVKMLSANYLDQQRQLERQLQAEKESGRANRKEIESLKDKIEALKVKYKRDSLDIVARSVTFAYVDESELDSLELLWRDCILAGDFKEAVRIGNEMELCKLSATRLDNLDRSVAATRDQLDETLRTAQMLEQHIINLENLYYNGETPLFGYDTSYAEKNAPYYEALTELYGRLYELYTSEFRCSEAFITDLKTKYAHSLYRLAFVCQRTYGFALASGYTDAGQTALRRAAALDDYDALMALFSLMDISYNDRRQYVKQARGLIDNETTREHDWWLVDFVTVHQGDTLYCHRLDAPSEVAHYGEHAVVLCSVHPSSRGTKLVIPAAVEHEGTTHTIKVLGKYACCDSTYRWKASLILADPYYYPEGIRPTTTCNTVTAKTELVIANSITTLMQYSIGSNFKKISIPQSVTGIQHGTLPQHKTIDVRLTGKSHYVLKDGVLYSKDLQRIAAFVTPDIKELHVGQDFKFTDSFFGFLPSLSFPDSLERFVVDPRNPYYTTTHGLLIDKQKDSLLYVPRCAPAYPFDKHTLAMMEYMKRQTNGQASRHKYRVQSSWTNKRYVVESDVDSIGKQKIFDYLLNACIDNHNNRQATVATPDGRETDIPGYIETLLPYISAERLTYWGRTYIFDNALDYQQIGLTILEYAHGRYGRLTTDEKIEWPSPVRSLMPQAYQDYTDYNTRSAQNRIKAAELDPEWHYDFLIADSKRANGEFEAALQHVEKAFEKGETASGMYVSGTYLSKKADILFDMGRYNEAVDVITENIAQNEMAAGYSQRAFYYNHLGKTDQAIDDYTAYIKIMPLVRSDFLGRADMYMAKGDTLLARKDYEEAATRTFFGSSNCDHYAHCMLGNYDKAKECIDNNIMEAPNMPSTYYDAACVYSRMGDYDTALEYLKTALAKGYRRYGLLMIAHDLEHLRTTEEFKQLIHQYFAYLQPAL